MYLPTFNKKGSANVQFKVENNKPISIQGNVVIPLCLLTKKTSFKEYLSILTLKAVLSEYINLIKLPAGFRTAEGTNYYFSIV